MIFGDMGPVGVHWKKIAFLEKKNRFRRNDILILSLLGGQDYLKWPYPFIF